MSEENQETIQNEEEIEEEINDGNSNIRLQKAVDLLIKSTGINPEKLKNLTLEEQFDRLEFLADNQPKETKSIKSKNKPVVPIPTDIDAPKFGRKVKDERGGSFYLFKPNEWLNRKKEK